MTESNRSMNRNLRVGAGKGSPEDVREHDLEAANRVLAEGGTEEEILEAGDTLRRIADADADADRATPTPDFDGGARRSPPSAPPSSSEWLRASLRAARRRRAHGGSSRAQAVDYWPEDKDQS